MTFQVGEYVHVHIFSYYAKIIKELNNDMIYITTPCGLGRDVPKNNIRETLFGEVLTKFPKGKEILVIRNEGIGKIVRKFKNTCLIKFEENSLGRDYFFHQLKKV